MKITDFPVELTPIPGTNQVWHGTVSVQKLHEVCANVRAKGGRLAALWASDERDKGGGYGLYLALVLQPGLVCVHAPLDAQHHSMPDISAIFPAANRMQRALHDLLGLHIIEAADHRKWLRHDAWPDNQYPLRKDFSANTYPLSSPQGDDYPFVMVSGEGVHEIPVGPVHAGIIEPGHFRFQVVGEEVLRLEERLGYTHKGIEKLFEGMTLTQGARLAGRISGDSTVAYAWAYAMAAEGVSRTPAPQRALWLRALLLERERIMNHLGDLGALGSDAGFAFGLAQFSRLKEDLLRSNAILFGHRYLMDVIIPGGVAQDLDTPGIAQLMAEMDVLQKEVLLLKNIYDEHAGLQDRFLSVGRVTPELAAHLCLTGPAGRASAQAWDLRTQFPHAPYDQLDVHMATHRNGDVAARVTVRFEEALESLRLCRTLLEQLPSSEIATPLQPAPADSLGIGWVEGWRGEILLALHTGKDQSIYRAHAHDPSWQNWPALEHAVMGNIVPDFPLINKSFNLSYSGHDL